MTRTRRAALVAVGSALTMLVATVVFARLVLERTERPAPSRRPGAGAAFVPVRDGLRLGDGREIPPASLERGRRAYLLYCVSCHGVDGDGRGPAAVGLVPAPRDLRRGEFKFASVPAGRLPTDADLARTVGGGLPGTAMLPAQDVGARTLDDLVQYLKTFSPRWVERRPGEPIPISPDPWGVTRAREAAARGSKVYHALAQCASCHPAYAGAEEIRAANLEFLGRDVPPRPDATFPVAKESAWGAPAWPPDFRRDALRAGETLPDLYRTIAAGVGGTAMPTWKGALSEDDLWALAYYVRSLRPRRAP